MGSIKITTGPDGAVSHSVGGLTLPSGSLPVLGLVDVDGILQFNHDNCDPDKLGLPPKPDVNFFEIMPRNLVAGTGFGVCIYHPLLASRPGGHDIRPAKLLALLYFMCNSRPVEASLWIDCGSGSNKPQNDTIYGIAAEPKTRQLFLIEVVTDLSEQFKPHDPDKPILSNAFTLNRGTFIAPFELHVLVHNKEGQIWATNSPVTAWNIVPGPDGISLVIEKARSAWARHRKACEGFLDYQRTGSLEGINTPELLCKREDGCLMICPRLAKPEWRNGKDLSRLVDFDKAQKGGQVAGLPRRSSAVLCLMVDHRWLVKRPSGEAVPIIDTIYGDEKTSAWPKNEERPAMW